MIEQLSQLSEEERDVILNAPAWVTILVAAADNEIDKKEIEEAINVVTLKMKRARKELLEYYKKVGSSFESNLKGHLTLLPNESEKRTQILIENLKKLNGILPKIDQAFAIQYYESLKDIATKTAEATGGLMGFLSIGYEESKIVDLKMIKNPSKN